MTGRKEEKLFIANNNFVIYSRCFRMKMNIAEAIAEATQRAKTNIGKAQEELQTAQQDLNEVITKENKILLETTSGVLNGIEEQFEEQEKKLTAEKEQLDVALEEQKKEAAAALKAQQKQAAKELQAQQKQAAAALNAQKAVLEAHREKAAEELKAQIKKDANELNAQKGKAAIRLKEIKQMLMKKFSEVQELDAKRIIIESAVEQLEKDNNTLKGVLRRRVANLNKDKDVGALSVSGSSDSGDQASSVTGQLESIEESIEEGIEEEKLRGLEWQSRLRF